MNPLREKILTYLDEKNECIKMTDDEDYKTADHELSKCMNSLSDYLNSHKDKDIILEYVADILIASGTLNDVIRCCDFHTAFFIGLKLGKEIHNCQYDVLIDKLNKLVVNSHTREKKTDGSI